MATFSLVHGAWHGGWVWNRLRAELEARGHVVATPDLPCDDIAADVADYARCVPPAHVVVGHSLGGLTISLVDADVRVYLCALARLLRPQAPVDSFELRSGRAAYIVCTQDAAIEPEWQRRAAAALGGDCHELAAGHSPMLTHTRELADLLEA